MLISLALLACLGLVHSKPCGSQQFWNQAFEECLNCTVCHEPDVVVTPCQGHRDTICGPMSRLNIDWSWMKPSHTHRNSPDKEMTETFKENMQEIKLHELLVKEREQRNRLLENRVSSTEEGDNFDEKEKIWERLKNLNRDTSHKEKLLNDLRKPKIISEHPKILEIPDYSDPLKVPHFSSEEAERLLKSLPQDSDPTPFEPNKLRFDHQALVKKFGFFPVDDVNDEPELADDDVEDVSEAVMDFSATERVILDYQTGVLYFAVGSVLIFFGVALCYSLKHIRTWGSRNYVQDLEELQYWLTSKKKDLPPSSIYKTTTEVISKRNQGQCKYLERIITKNAKKKLIRVPDNVYQGPCVETRPLTSSYEDPEVHKPVRV